MVIDRDSIIIYLYISLYISIYIYIYLYIYITLIASPPRSLARRQAKILRDMQTNEASEGGEYFKILQVKVEDG